MIITDFKKQKAVELGEMTGGEILQNAEVFDRLISNLDSCLEAVSHLAISNGRNHKDADMLQSKIGEIQDIAVKDYKEMLKYIDKLQEMANRRT